MDHINHLLGGSFPSVFAFSGVLLCCVSSEVMKINYQYCYKSDTVYSNTVPFHSLLSLH